MRNPNQRSTWLSHEEPVGVKCIWKRGCLASQSLTAGVLWVAGLSQTRCTFSSAGTALSIATKNFLNSTARCWGCSWEITVPLPGSTAPRGTVTLHRALRRRPLSPRVSGSPARGPPRSQPWPTCAASPTTLEVRRSIPRLSLAGQR